MSSGSEPSPPGAAAPSSPAERPSFLRVKAFTCPKEEKAWENQDAHAIASNLVAVADGATRYWKSGLWSRWLVSRYVALPPSRDPSKPLAERWQLWLEDVCREWNAARYDLRDGGPGPWEQQKAQKGSASTLMGLEVEQGSWRAEWLGDPVLFHVRSDGRIDHYPSEWQATDKPDFAYSLSSSNAKGPTWASVREARGSYHRDDLFLLTTDALAPLLLRWDATDLVKASHDAWGGGSEFSKFVAEQREAGTIPNDDTTLLVVAFRDDREAVSRELMRQAKAWEQKNQWRSQGWYLHFLLKGENAPGSPTPTKPGAVPPGAGGAPP